MVYLIYDKGEKSKKKKRWSTKNIDKDKIGSINEQSQNNEFIKHDTQIKNEKKNNLENRIQSLN